MQERMSLGSICTHERMRWDASLVHGGVSYVHLPRRLLARVYHHTPEPRAIVQTLKEGGAVLTTALHSAISQNCKHPSDPKSSSLSGREMHVTTLYAGQSIGPDCRGLSIPFSRSRLHGQSNQSAPCICLHRILGPQVLSSLSILVQSRLFVSPRHGTLFSLWPAPAGPVACQQSRLSLPSPLEEVLKRTATSPPEAVDLSPLLSSVSSDTSPLVLVTRTAKQSYVLTDRPHTHTYTLLESCKRTKIHHNEAHCRRDPFHRRLRRGR